MEPASEGIRLALVGRPQVREPMRAIEPLMGFYGKRVSVKYVAALKRMAESSC